MAGELTLFPEFHPARYGDGRSFQRLFLSKLLDGKAHDLRLNGQRQDTAYQILLKWADLETSGKLVKMKETALQGEFLAEVFGTALGYTLFSENLPIWNLQAQYAVPDGTADAAIGIFTADNGHPPRVLIELKGPRVNVDRDRVKGRTPVQQCWDYLNVSPDCPWGLVCNYVSFRLYHRRKTPRAFEHFALQELRDRDRFLQFYYLFERGGLLPQFAGAWARADQLLEETDNRQREVGRELYKNYHEQRLALIDHLQRKHNKTLDAAIHIAQRLLDRIVFIAFCEDRDLLPAKSIDKAWRELPPFTKVTNPRWANFRLLFESVDRGNPTFNITAYNGGLFKNDPQVDEIELTDEWTDFFREVSTYDFRDEVNVDVLGHIFEQSVTDLELLRTKPEPEKKKSLKKVSGKRKREGIYYTPTEITRYLVEHTVGACLRDRFDALARQHAVNPDADPAQQPPDRWTAFQEARWEALRRLRVCDPACGSGAFLIQAFDYLENAYLDVLAALTPVAPRQAEHWRDNVPSTILRENLFGVDLSQEAVEITRLALWIRTAERGKTLADLSQNIRHGNSLVDDPTVTPDAFDWTREFPQVFADGRFDCIISNPPYVKLQNFRKRQPKIAQYLVAKYRAAQTGNFDLYLPFMERGLDLLQPDGRMGFIAPSVWLFNEYGAGLRNLIKERQALARFVDFKSHQVFADATTYTALQFFAAQPQHEIAAADARHGDLNRLQFYPVDYSSLGTGAWAFLTQAEQRVIDKMNEKSVPLKEATEQIFQGLITSADHIYHLIKLKPGRYWSNAANGPVDLEDELLKPLVSGEEAVPFATPPTETYLIFPYTVSGDECRLLTEAEMESHKNCWAYLKDHESKLRNREGGKFDDDHWWRFGRHQNMEKQVLPKLLVPRLLLDLFAGIDPLGALCIDNVDVGGVLFRKGWDGHYLLGVLNSNACNFVWRRQSKPFRGEYRSANKQFIAPLPVPKTKDQKPVAKLARELAKLHGKQLAAYRSVQRRLAVDLPPNQPKLIDVLPPKLPGKLQGFDTTPLAQLLREMEKFAKRQFTPKERAQWDGYLTTATNDLAIVKRAIADQTAELNERVNALYGLSPNDVKLIRDSGRDASQPIEA